LCLVQQSSIPPKVNPKRKKFHTGGGAGWGSSPDKGGNCRFNINGDGPTKTSFVWGGQSEPRGGLMVQGKTGAQGEWGAPKNHPCLVTEDESPLRKVKKNKTPEKKRKHLKHQ